MKRLLMVLAGLVLVLCVVVVIALSMIDANRFRPQIQASLSQALGRPVTLGALHVSVWSGSLDADRIRIGDDPAFGTRPFIQARSLEVGVRLWPLLIDHALHVTSLKLDAPTVRLLQDRAGRWNFASFAAGGAAPSNGAAASSSAAPALRVDALRIVQGRIVVRRAGGGTRSYDDVSLTADHIDAAHAFPFTLHADVPGNGRIVLSGSFGPWAAGDAVRTPLTAHLTMQGIDLVQAGLVNHRQGIRGVFDLDSHLHSAGGVMSSRGLITARHLQLVASGSPAPQPIRLDYQADYRLASGTGRIHDTRLGTGKAALDVAGRIDTRGKVLRLDLALTGHKLPIDDLQPLLPAFGVVLPRRSHLSGGTLGVDLHARGPLDALVIRGPVTLDQTTLAGFSIGSKLGGALALAGIQAPADTRIEHASATLRIAPQGIRADPFTAVVAGIGTLSGKGTMAANGALDASLLVKLDKTVASRVTSSKVLGGSRAGRLLGDLLGGSSRSGIGIHVGGTASNPSFRPDPAATAALLRAGFGGGSAPSSSRSRSRPASRSGSVLGNLLQQALHKGKP